MCETGVDFYHVDENEDEQIIWHSTSTSLQLFKNIVARELKFGEYGMYCYCNGEGRKLIEKVIHNNEAFASFFIKFSYNGDFITPTKSGQMATLFERYTT